MKTAQTAIVGFKCCVIAFIAATVPVSEPGPLAARPPDIVVTTTAELEAALSPGNEGGQIFIRAGEYDLSHPLTVPDGATVAGEGVMGFDESGLPTGFEASGRTVLRATAALAGDVVTLGNGATLQGLVIEDLAGRLLRGNPVAVVSRAAGDFISAHIEACEIINPNSSASTGQGPSGRGLVVITRNPSPPHEGAVLRVQVTQSIVRSPAAGIGVFAINFASHARIKLDLENNVIGGGLNATGGVGSPDAVTGASVTIQSRRNLYRSDSPVPTPIGWTLFGGADLPSLVLASKASALNSLEIDSHDDAIEAFATGISAAGARRFNSLSEPLSSNSVDMVLLGTRVATTTTDLRLSGATSLAGGTPGDNNTLRVLVSQATGSGLRANQYADSRTPSMLDLGTGNRLEIIGNANAFDQTNTGFFPPPPAESFTVQR
jgi:hypothetical protein